VAEAEPLMIAPADARDDAAREVPFGARGA